MSSAQEKNILKLDNPISIEYLNKNLRKSQPRLILNAKLEKELKKKMKTNPVLQNMYKAIKLNSESIFSEPFLEQKVIGWRMLKVSSEMLYRVNMLAFVYLMEKEPEILRRINDELVAVCNFSDWNPQHFLDVAEMSMAVALALDWTAGNLPESTIQLAKSALVEKGIKPSWSEIGNRIRWVNRDNNWNQVCNGGMIAAALAVAEDEPELAVKTISRALNSLPYALEVYMPDGIYPEGTGYWYYGTSYTVLAAAMLESTFGHDFGIGDYPGFKESATFRYLMNTPLEGFFNFSDCADKRADNGDLALAWFASKLGNKEYFEKERFLREPKDMGKLERIAGVAMVWLSQYEEKAGAKLPVVWKGDGMNPLIVFKNEDDTNGFYLGAKGGKGMINHANMDAGSFVFELNGVRWGIDPGSQKYHDLEKTGFDLWSRSQESDRWTLLTKNNFGHSTITINNTSHCVDGFVPITDFKSGEKPQATFDMTAAFGDLVTKATRSFIKDSPSSIVVEDEILKSDKTKLITWQFMTTADVEITDDGAILKQDGKTVRLENISHPDLTVSVISLCPAPLKLDKQIPNLKRLEIRLPAWRISGEKTKIKVRLSGVDLP
jgi:hypothetical protein